MEFELKEADIFKIESGDILVVALPSGIDDKAVKYVLKGLERLERRVEERSGKKICTMVMDQTTDLSLYRKIE